MGIQVLLGGGGGGLARLRINGGTFRILVKHLRRNCLKTSSSVLCLDLRQNECRQICAKVGEIYNNTVTRLGMLLLPLFCHNSLSEWYILVKKKNTQLASEVTLAELNQNVPTEALQFACALNRLLPIPESNFLKVNILGLALPCPTNPLLCHTDLCFGTGTPI